MHIYTNWTDTWTAKIVQESWKTENTTHIHKKREKIGSNELFATALKNWF